MLHYLIWFIKIEKLLGEWVRSFKSDLKCDIYVKFSVGGTKQAF